MYLVGVPVNQDENEDLTNAQPYLVCYSAAAQEKVFAAIKALAAEDPAIQIGCKPRGPNDKAFIREEAMREEARQAALARVESSKLDDLLSIEVSKV
jgi:hypothetical protein